MIEKIKKIANEIEADVINIRRKIHQNPELAMEEFKTAKLVSDKLKDLGIEVIEKVGKTGIVGLLKGEGQVTGKTIALRADMDALPIEEETNLSYRSVNKKIMHACGHDAHTSILLGAATILSKVKDEINGNVKFIFQPSEESPLGGAEEMIKEGVLEDPKVDGVFGLHVDPDTLSGLIGCREGAFFAAGGGFEIEILGKGGHGAQPNKAIDAISIAGEVIQALQKISSSKIDPMEPFVLTIGTISGGSKANIIADRVVMTGTLRCFSKEIISNSRSIIENIIKSITSAYGAEYKFKLVIGDTPLINDKNMIHIVRKTGEQIVGFENVIEANRTLLGEDFVSYSKRVPSAFVFLGVGFNNKENYPLHHPKFEIDESALSIGTALLSYSAINYLNNREEGRF
jgi:amidohydrolase